MINKIVNKIKSEILKEATSDRGGNGGSYITPLRPGKRIFQKSQLGPYQESVSKYYSQQLATDSYDGKMNTPKNKIKNIESKAKKSSIYAKNHPVQNDDDGDVINPYPRGKKINEWYYEEAPMLTESTNIWYENINEDLAVWFGTKKKPKGSKQPKGPWVNICRKVDGKHPPCGRKEGESKAYPKCRAAGVAGKMSDSEKKSACAQKRREEKKNPKIGKGNKPTMVSYNPKK